MKLSNYIPKTESRCEALLFGCMCLFSSVTLLGDGIYHLQMFVPLASLNLAVGAFGSERLARVLLRVEGGVILGLFGYVAFQLHALFPDT